MIPGVFGVRELLTYLLAATPEPRSGAAVEDLLAAFEAILADRAAIIARIVPPLTLSETDRPLLDELDRRQQTWHLTLSEALRMVGGQRHGATQLRAYAGAG